MFNKFLGYFKYRKIIKENYDTLNQRYKFKYDKIYGRLYTVLSITEERQEVLKTYGYDYLDGEVKKFIGALDTYFFTIGLSDLVAIDKIDSIDPVNVLIVLRYKFKTHQTIMYIVFGILGLVATVSLVTVFVKFLIFLINFILHF